MDVIEYLAENHEQLAQATTRHNDNVYSLVHKEHAEKVMQLVWPSKKKCGDFRKLEEKKSTKSIDELIAQATANNTILLELTKRIEQNAKIIEQLEAQKT